ncbi:MAG: hypothetical protein H6617_02965 [Bdellovibrionaceae bacterium]|nr:hypothetical protein [Pseudobdellovibrionaceae bacterium]
MQTQIDIAALGSFSSSLCRKAASVESLRRTTAGSRELVVEVGRNRRRAHGDQLPAPTLLSKRQWKPPVEAPTSGHASVYKVFRRGSMRRRAFSQPGLQIEEPYPNLQRQVLLDFHPGFPGAGLP